MTTTLINHENFIEHLLQLQSKTTKFPTIAILIRLITDNAKPQKNPFPEKTSFTASMDRFEMRKNTNTKLHKFPEFVFSFYFTSKQMHRLVWLLLQTHPPSMHL
jgi:hypothetical protein